MEEQFSKEDKLMKRLLKEAGAEKPTLDFKQNLMAKLAARERVIRPYEPLISKTAWLVIFSIGIFVILGLNFWESDVDINFAFNFKLPQLIDFSRISISQNMLYAFGCVALFIVQIPFVKRLIDKQFQL